MPSHAAHKPAAIGLKEAIKSASWPIVLALILIGLIWVIAILYLRGERESTEKAAIQNSANLAGAFEEHLLRTLNEIDRSIKIIRANHVQDPQLFDLRAWAKSNQLFDDQTLQLSIISPDGFIKQSTIESTTSVGTDLRDREHFQFHARATGDPLHISKPVIGRTTGLWSIQLTRRVAKPDDSFDGMIVVSLNPEYLARFYSSVNLGPDGYVRVVGRDGIIRAVGGTTQAPLGTDLSEADLFKHFPVQSSGWYYTESNFSDRVPRLVTFQAVENYPLVITIGRSKSNIFAGIDRKRTAYYAAAGVLTLIIALVTGVAVRGRMSQLRLAEERDLQNRRLDAVMTNMPSGVCMFDEENRLAVYNDRYRQMYKMPEDLVTIGRLLLTSSVIERCAGHL